MTPVEKIKQIQSIINATADGIWGVKSQAALDKASKAQLKNVQNILGVVSDGIFGTKSRVALEILKTEARNYKPPVIMPEVDIIDLKKPIIVKIINAFETGTSNFDYDAVFIIKDGVFPGSLERTSQITISYGLTETGRLVNFIKEYVALNSKYSKDFQPYLAILGKKTLANNSQFKNLLKAAAQNDPDYVALLLAYYERYYYGPGLRWFKENGFQTPLGLACCQDSFLHSGGVLQFLRNRFSASPKDGDILFWTQYMITRRDWLKTHSDPILRKIWTRPQFYLDLINQGDWNLEREVYYPNGIKVSA